MCQAGLAGHSIICMIMANEASSAGEICFYENPVSSRHWVAERLAETLAHLRPRRIASRTPHAMANAHDLAAQLDDGTRLVVIGGDGQFNAAVNAVKLAGKADVTVNAVAAGNSGDGPYTHHGRVDFLRHPQLLQDLLVNGQDVPVNAMRLSGVVDRIVALYAGFGLTAHSAAMVNNPWVRHLRNGASLHGRYNRLGRGVDTLAVGATTLSRLMRPPLEVIQDGQPQRVYEMSFIMAHRIAGSLLVEGQAFSAEPQIASISITPSNLALRLGQATRAYMRGHTLETRLHPEVNLKLLSATLGHIEGEQLMFPAGCLQIKVDPASYFTRVTPERAEQLAQAA